jgi:hypothetical protein
MRKITLACCLVFLALAFGPKSFAQDDAKTQDAAKTPAPPNHYYHLDIVVQEVSAEGKPVNSRSYSTTVVTNSHDRPSIRANSRIPVVTGVIPADAKDNAAVNTQIEHHDIGVRIDISDVHDVGRLLTFNLVADVASIGGTETFGTNVHEPTIRHNQWDSAVLIPIGKPTVVFKSDDLDSKGSVQVVVTATLLQ